METLIQQLIKAFGWGILNSLWQSALIYAVLFIILVSLPKLGAKYKHNLAFGSIVLMFFCFAYNLSAQLLKNISQQTNAINIKNLEAYSYLNNLPESFSSKAETYFPIVVGFYIIGIVLQLFVIIKGYHQLSKFKKECLSEIPETWKTIFIDVKIKLKLNKKIQFQISSIVNVPLVIGYLKPIVLFPLALVNQLDNDQIEAILIHELSHIRRNDFLLNLIKTGIETLLFFNPFVWMAGKFIHIEREHACDDLVLKITGKPLNYAHALLKLELLKDKNSPTYALAATGKTQNLYQRIKRITNMKTNYLNAKQQMAALTLGIACLFSIAWINPSQKSKAKGNTAKTIELIKTISSVPSVYLDTTKKRKVKIVTIDHNGKKTEYNSVKEMPDSIRKDFLTENLPLSKTVLNLSFDSLKFDHKFDTLAFASTKAYFASPEWKKQQEDIKKQTKEIKIYFDSPEWKKQRVEIAKQAAEAGKTISIVMKNNMLNADEISKIEILKPEMQKEVEKLQMSALSANKANGVIELSTLGARTLRIYDNSSKNLRNSDEYKKLREKFDKQVEELKEKLEKQKGNNPK